MMFRFFFMIVAVATAGLLSEAHATDLIGGEAPVMLTPEEAVKKFTMAEGFEVNCWASEVDSPIESPAAMTFDSLGRLWVTNIPSHPHAKPDAKPKDSIVVLEDTDKDGIADKSTVFYDDLYLPMGLAVADGGRTVYVGSEPNLLKLTDHDGDLKADSAEIMMQGFGTEDNHHYISGFEWGPDGRLYFGQGLFLNTQVETPFGVVRAHEAAVFRLDPRNHRLEVHSSFGWSNVWGISFDKWGEPLMADASPAMNYYLTQFASRFDYPKPDKYADYIKKRGGYSFTPTGRRPSCGNEILSNEHWPEDVRGWYTTNQMKGWHGVRWYRIKKEGSGYTSDQPRVGENDEGELMTSSDITFRPVAQQIGPDGALYVLDYYNPIVGHTTYNFRDPRRIQTHGRVWRITAKDRDLVWQPEIRTAENEALLEMLLSPNERWGYFARRELQQRDEKKVLAAADAWLKKKSGDDHALLEVLWLAQNFNQLQPDRLERLISSDSSDARTAGIRILREWQAEMPEEKSLGWLKKTIVDENQHVRLASMVALGFHPNSETALPVAAGALDLEMDLGMELATRETLGWLSKQVNTVPEKVDSFLIPSLTDKELLSRDLNPQIAEELLARATVSFEKKQESLKFLGEKKNRDALSELFNRVLHGDGPPAIESLLLRWPQADFNSKEKSELAAKLATEGRTAADKTIGHALFLRGGAVPHGEANQNQMFAAMALAGRGKVKPEWHPIVLSAAGKSANMTTVKALPLFPAQDQASAAALVEIINANREKNIPLAFAALDALKRIPKTAWPEGSENLALTKIRISATGDLRFDPAEFKVSPGEAVELTFYNPDNLYHNLAIVKLEFLNEIGIAADMMAGSPDGLKKDYLPDHSGILHATPQLTIGSARTHTLRFFAPLESGEYPYICTYPGHWRAMRGTMYVVEDR